MTPPKGRVLISINTTWNLVNFRSGLIRALIAEGYEVIAAAPPDAYVDRLLALGCRYEPLPMDNQGTHPGRDLHLFWRYVRLFRQVRPDVFLGYTIKPNIYGSLAAHLMGISVINNVSGLGAVFIRDGWVTRLVRGLYRLAFSRSAKVFFQNEDDRCLFVSGGLVSQAVTERLPGSGIDLARFSPVESQLSDAPRTFRFLLIARLLWDKGVGEYIAAARMVRQSHPDVECCLLGFLDVQNPAAISRKQVAEWEAEGAVGYLGATEDIRPELVRADCVVLPSYREGTPRSLLEAAAVAKPIITTDAVGCREVVNDGVNGFLCKVRDADSLADAMQRMVDLTPLQRDSMGRQGRAKMEREFDEQIVIGRYLAVIRHHLSSLPTGLPGA